MSIVVAALGLSCGGDDNPSDNQGGANGRGGSSRGGNGNTGGGSPQTGGTSNPSSGGSSSGGTTGSGGTNSSGGTGGTNSCAAPGAPTVDVLTRSYDLARTNSNLRERTLNTGNVSREQFGKLFELEVDDQVYAQILYVSELCLQGKTRNVIFVATVNNSVYAFDADTKGPPLWHKNFNGAGRPSRNTEVGFSCGGTPPDQSNYKDFSGNIGIVGTPVIDRASGSMYFITRTVEGADTFHRIRAVDILTGNEKSNSGKVIAPTATGNPSYDGPVGETTIQFNPKTSNQRTALALHNGVVYAGWAAFCDWGPYHGWLLGFNAETLDQVSVLNASPNQDQAGFWQAGAAPVFDAEGKLYIVTGNGAYDPAKKNYGNTVLRLNSQNLTVEDHFAPTNFGYLNSLDWDLGSTGPTLLPGTDLLVMGGKEGKVYLLNTKNLGALSEDDEAAVQTFQGVDHAARPDALHHLHNAVAVWRGPQGLNMYVSGENDYLRAYRFDDTQKKFIFPASVVSNVLPPQGMPGGMLTVSADGAKAGTGIVWSTTPRAGDANQNVTPGVLRAFNAENLNLLWESTLPADDVYDFAKFNNPTVVNGKVYAASFSHRLSVYGLRNGVPPNSTNLALHKTVTTPGATSCNEQEGPEKVTDGNVYAQDGSDKFKWCSHTENATLLIDLGAAQQVNKIIVRHAGAGGETILFNTKDFRVEVSSDGVTFEPVANVTNNTWSSTVHEFAARSARYVRVVVDTPTHNGNGATRIVEVEVYGP